MKKIATDPLNSMQVRFTDNGLREDDFYPDNQDPKMLILDPAGEPYAYRDDLGDGDPVDHR